MANDLFNNVGQLTKYGKETFDTYLGKELTILLNSIKNVDDLLTFKAVLVKYVADKVMDKKISLQPSKEPSKIEMSQMLADFLENDEK